MIKTFYGLSGTFKSTTIQVEQKKENSLVVWSMIKPWKKLESGIFKDKTMITDLNFAMLHLCNLENVLRNNSNNVLIERGVTDMAFYWLRKNSQENDEWIKRSVVEELNLCGEGVEKILLVQKDLEFISKTVLEEKTRAAVFPGGVEEYLRLQEDYIEFTKKYNQITKTIEIENAETYLNSLGIEFKI